MKKGELAHVEQCHFVCNVFQKLFLQCVKMEERVKPNLCCAVRVDQGAHNVQRSYVFIFIMYLHYE